jgi:TRAP-type C4-dicarboxylate transport system substrate-binding protein
LESDELRRKAVVLAWLDVGPRVWFSTKKPFTNPSDFYSATINGLDDPISIETASVLKAKASAAPLQGSALLDGLVRGQFDVADALLDEAVFGQGATVKAYLTLSYHVWEVSVLIVDPALWSNLASGEQQLLLNAAFEAERVNRGYGLSQQIALLEKARSKGIEIVSLNETDRHSFARQVYPVYEKWRTGIGPVLFDEFMTRVREGQSFP